MDRAPSFHDVMDVDDRVIFVQTLSKNWAMTGMRVGWIEAPEAFGGVIENLIQYSTSGVATPIQRAAIAALDDGEAFVSGQRERLLASRDVLCSALFATGRIRFATPPGSFYLFCSIDGFDDSRELAIRLLNEALVGVAPGDAFGVAGSGFLRLCFARDPATMTIAAERLVQWVRDQPSRA
jgi:aspartate/methionine/tyrosine aminotransferase